VVKIFDRTASILKIIGLVILIAVIQVAVFMVWLAPKVTQSGGNIEIESDFMSVIIENGSEGAE